MQIHRAVGPLRVLLVLVFAALLAAQVVVLPMMVAEQARALPDLAHLRWPLLVVAVLGLVCVQVVIVATWKLLTLVQEDRIFTEGSLVWVDAIVWAIGVAWVLLLGVLGYVLGTWEGAGLPALLLVLLLVGAVLGLLVVVLRALLRQATTLRSDMEAVI